MATTVKLYDGRAKQWSERIVVSRVAFGVGIDPQVRDGGLWYTGDGVFVLSKYIPALIAALEKEAGK